MFREIYYAKTALLQAVFDAHADTVVSMFQKYQSQNKPGPHKDGLHERALKQHCYSVIAAGVDAKSVLATRSASNVKVDTAAMAKSLIDSPFMSDQLFGFAQYLQGSASKEDKLRVRQEVCAKFATHPDSIESYILVLGGLDSDDAPAIIKELISDKVTRERGERRSRLECAMLGRSMRVCSLVLMKYLFFEFLCVCVQMFNVNLAGHARTLARAWSMQRKRSLLTDDGLEVTIDLFTRIGTPGALHYTSSVTPCVDLLNMCI